MSLIPTIYSSSDPGAPQLTGQAGSLLSLLRALLVTGYGTAPSDKAGLGWTEEFTGTDKAVFRNNPVSGSGSRLRVVDDGSAGTGGNARTAAMRAYSAMSDIDTGDDPTPTPAQWALGVLWMKSNLLDATARPWWAIGNERCLYLFIDVFGDGRLCPMFFGDLLSFKAGDLHNFYISGSSLTTFNGSSTSGNTFHWLWAAALQVSTTPSTTSGSGYIMRGSSGAVGAVLCGSTYLMSGIPSSQNRAYGADGLPYPVVVGGGALFERPLVIEGGNAPRGVFPGVWFPLHNRPFDDLSVLSSYDESRIDGDLLVRNYTSSASSSSSFRGQALFEIGVEWA